MTNIDHDCEELATVDGGVYWPGAGCFPNPFPYPHPLPLGAGLGIIGGPVLVCLDGGPNVY